MPIHKHHKNQLDSGEGKGGHMNPMEPVKRKEFSPKKKLEPLKRKKK